MSSIFTLSLLLLSLSSATKPSDQQPLITSACKATRNTTACESYLSQTKPPHQNPTPIQLIHTAIELSHHHLNGSISAVESILHEPNGTANRTHTCKTCLEVFKHAQHRTTSAKEALAQGEIKDSRVWLSATLQYQSDCWGGLKYVNGTKKVNDVMAVINDAVGVTSISLSMLVSYDIYGNDTRSWKPPSTERNGSWEAVGGGRGGGSGGVKRGVPAGLVADVTVCKSGRGGGCYEKIQEAVDSAPDYKWDGWFVIRIKEGVYDEIVRVPFEKMNVVFLGDGMGRTVITGSLNAGQVGVSTYESATVAVMGDGFMAKNITFQNTAGTNAHQAVAFRSDSDLSVIENCEFIGNQDTLYVRSLRQFYKSCRIKGNIDFIFGNAAAVFQRCLILVSPRQETPEKGESNTLTAQGRTDPAQSTGFVFKNCIINGTEEYVRLYKNNTRVHKSYLGRPWKEYSRTVYIGCEMGEIIHPDGWMPWTGDFALETLYYGEFGNYGPGAKIEARVWWSSTIVSKHLHAYSVENFIQGDKWIPPSKPQSPHLL